MPATMYTGTRLQTVRFNRAYGLVDPYNAGKTICDLDIDDVEPKSAALYIGTDDWSQSGVMDTDGNTFGEASLGAIAMWVSELPTEAWEQLGTSFMPSASAAPDPQPAQQRFVGF